MPAKIGTIIPNVDVELMGPHGPVTVKTDDIFSGRNVMVFGFPGAFTPYCHSLHLPSVLEDYDTFKENGADYVICTAVNDIYVLEAWGEELGAAGKILFMADGNGYFAQGLDMFADFSLFGIGFRSRRYSLWAEDREIKQISVTTEPFTAQLVSAEILPALYRNTDAARTGHFANLGQGYSLLRPQAQGDVKSAG